MTEQEFDLVLKKAFCRYVENIVEKTESEPEHEFSDRFKKRINRLFREQVGKKDAMYPEVDTRYERMRSGIVRTGLVAEHKLKKAFKRGNPT